MQLDCDPLETDNARPSMFDTEVAVVLVSTPPLPSWPQLLRPTHFTLRVVVRKQVYPLPIDICSTPEVSPTTSTGEVEEVGDALALTLFTPQHFAPPAVVTAHTVCEPTAIDFTPDVSPCTSPAVVESTPVPLPFRVPLPMHFTPADGVITHTTLFVLTKAPVLT
jgi:hypothetical protein